MGNEQEDSGIDIQREQSGELNEFSCAVLACGSRALNAYAIAETACLLVVEKLGAERAFWEELDWATRDYVIGAAFHVPHVSVIDDRFPFDA